ncbi:MAG: glucose-1-phosphate adenylyltransferase [Candidatus Omnitrophica bacterium]|nr:glucose-1-phosphate adenylyltransferase [Candidatus Omnitrophota bacterium]
MTDILCVILGGGRGTRLYPLTRDRSKPAVPLAGKYRLIDVPVSNCLNSGLNRIYVLTQFNSESLNKHITRTYNLDRFSRGFVEIIAAEQSMESTNWFQGTADAVRRSLKHFTNPNIRRILVLSGDQLYKLNFKGLIDFHDAKKAEITIACNPVMPEEISEFGIMGIHKDSRIMQFIEKPKKPSTVKEIMVQIDEKRCFLASMGIYLFEKDVLVDLLKNSTKVDFGREIIPSAFKTIKTYAFVHKGYWRDIGTMKAFYEANLAMTAEVPPIDMFDGSWPFFTRARNLPPAKVRNSHIESSTIADGCIIDAATIKHSVIGLRSKIGEASQIESSIILGCDYYDATPPFTKGKVRVPALGIGSGCVIKKAIIDKNVHIGSNVRIINKDNVANMDGDKVFIKDGIVIVAKNAVIPSNTVI